MQKVNLLFVITKLELGGAQKHLLSLVELLDKKRFGIFLFTCRKGYLLEEAKAIKGVTVRESLFLERPINPINDFLALIEIFCFIKKNNITIVHTHSSKAGLLGRLAGKFAGVDFMLHTVHGWSFNNYQPSLSRMLFIWMERIAARFSHKLIVVSDYDRKKGLENRIGEEDKYSLIRYGIDFSQFRSKRKDIKKTLGIDASGPVVGTVSCLKPQKSPGDFIKLAFLVTQNMPDVKFVIAGDGILRNESERLINSFGLQDKLFLLGWRRDIPDILGSLDAFVLTSKWEGLPISVLEAMAAEKPVIATNTGGIAEIVEDGKNGFLVECVNMKYMSEKLIALLKDANLRKTIGRNALGSLGPCFTLAEMVKNTQVLYDNLLSSRYKNY